MHKTLPTNPSLPLYLLLSSSYLTLQAAALLLSPRLIVTLLTSTTALRPPTTELESYLCCALAWSLLAVGGFGFGFAIARAQENEGDDGTSTSSASPPMTLVLLVTLLYHTVSALQAYVNYTSGTASGFLLHLVVSTGLGVYGLWVMVFGAQVRVSSVDGHDKRVSGFLFGGGTKKKV